MILMLLGLGFGLFLAYANGSNDNFKGVATLYGSGAATFRRALIWATLTTLAGSVAAIFLAQGLLAAFSGKGLVPDAVIAMKSFALAVALASAATVMLATRLGFPISTTHALTGSLVGAGFFASAQGVNLSKLGANFVTPLLVSPVMALLLTMMVYPLLRLARGRLGVKKELCVCVGNEVVGIAPWGTAPGQAIAMYATTMPTLSVGTEASCQERYDGKLLGLSAGRSLDAAHYLSAGMVSFARGLNDTPKIAAILIAASAFSPSFAVSAVAALIAVGGLLHSRGIARTMGHQVTTMNPGQGFVANFITGGLVIFASRLGLPVSTTHVSCGALFGIGLSTRQANVKTIQSILLAWVITLPVAGLLAAGLFAVLRQWTI